VWVARRQESAVLQQCPKVLGWLPENGVEARVRQWDGSIAEAAQ
jgi:hypothetical protein